MRLERYPAVSDFSHEVYEFFSCGPRGVIKKVVTFEEILPDLYNIAFGDWDETLQKIRDDVTSNNGDRDKVLATVAHVVIDFLVHHPGAILYAEGSTTVKTRLYQIGINKHWKEIGTLFEINGLTGGAWEKFSFKKNYEAFTIKTL